MTCFAGTRFVDSKGFDEQAGAAPIPPASLSQLKTQQPVAPLQWDSLSEGKPEIVEKVPGDSVVPVESLRWFNKWKNASGMRIWNDLTYSRCTLLNTCNTPFALVHDRLSACLLIHTSRRCRSPCEGHQVRASGYRHFHSRPIHLLQGTVIMYTDRTPVVPWRREREFVCSVCVCLCVCFVSHASVGALTPRCDALVCLQEFTGEHIGALHKNDALVSDILQHTISTVPVAPITRGSGTPAGAPTGARPQAAGPGQRIAAGPERPILQQAA